MTEAVIRKSIYLRAAPARVWAYLTDPERLATWFHKPNTALVSGPFEMRAADTGARIMWGNVRTAEPFKRLEYTFCMPPMGDTESLVRWTLEELPEGTRLSLVHEGLPQGADAFGLLLALDEGWDNHLRRMRGDLNVAKKQTVN